jgi:Big-like domain-containing protein
MVCVAGLALHADKRERSTAFAPHAKERGWSAGFSPREKDGEKDGRWSGDHSDRPPVVSITSPASGVTVRPMVPLTIKASATAVAVDGTIEVVKFYVDGVLIGRDKSAPFEQVWLQPQLGMHILIAVAQDDNDSKGISAPVTIKVAPNMPPTVSLTAPANGSSYVADPAAVTLIANATDDLAVARVEFFADSISLGVKSSPDAPLGSSYSFSWMARVGSHSLYAIATDSEGLSTKSAAVGITVTAPPPPPPPPPPPGDPTTAPLVQQANLVYQGAFRVPEGVVGGANLNVFQADKATFSFGGTSLAYNPANNSLFVVGHDQGQLVAEIDIPSALLSSTTTGGLNIASFRQPFTDVTDLQMSKVNPDPIGNPTATPKIGGLLPFESKLYASDYLYYDGTGAQRLSHFVSGLNLSVLGDAQGPFQVQRFDCDPVTGTNCLGAGFFDGYFGLVPVEWQAAFGGPVINGNCCLGVISRTSYGPSVFAVDPALLGATAPAPARPLVYYPTLHPLLEPGLQPCLSVSPTCPSIIDGWSLTSTLFNGTTEVRGVVFPHGTRSVLFFGRHGGAGNSPNIPGGGRFCYGPGTTDPALVGTLDPLDPLGIDRFCYDLEDRTKGVHGYPYRYYVWAYDANDLAKVSSGQADPWSVRPYALWSLNFPFSTTGMTRLGGAAYDPANGLIYVAQYQADGGAAGGANLPLIHVFKLQLP